MPGNYDEKMPRWIKASVFKFLTDLLQPHYAVFAEGAPRKTQNSKRWIELRIDGPDASEGSGWTRFDLTVNVFCNVQVDGTELYPIDDMFGKVANALDRTIAIFNEDTGALIDCLNTANKGPKIKPFGQVKAAVPLLQGAVEMSYWMVVAS